MNYKLLGYWLLGCYALPVHAESIQPSFINGPKLYVGGSVGGSQQGDSCNDPFFEGSCDNKDTSWKVFGGVRLNPMTGAEITYHELGTAKMNGVSGGTYASMKNSVSGTSISGVGYVPMAQGLEAFAKAADGKATKIIIPSDIQGITGLASSLKEIVTDPKSETDK